jgi:branched-chain amino acid transport system substrate-binding protein
MRKAALLAVAVALTAAACSSSSKSSSSTSTGSGSGSSGGGTGAPIKIAFLWFETGTYALPGRHNTLEMAINQINAQGGVDGHKFEYTAYDSGILPQQTVTAVLHAISDHPTVIIGMPVSSGVQAAASAIKSSGIPTIQAASDDSTNMSALGTTNMFRIISTVQEEATGTGEYIASKHPKTVGLFDDSDLNGVASMKLIRQYLQAHGVTNFVYREVAQGASDATEAALAMKGTDIVASQGFPQTEAAFVKDLYQNGITTQDVMSYGGTSILGYGLAPKAALANDAMLATCAPEDLSTPQAKAFTQAYESTYTSPSIIGSSPYVYDAVQMVAAAVKQSGGNLSSSALVRALSSVTYNGACGTYHSDSEHNLFHGVQIISGSDAPIATYTNMSS